MITQAPALFGLVVHVTEVSTSARTPNFLIQKEVSGIPWGGQASQDKDLSACRGYPEQLLPTTSRRAPDVPPAISIHTRTPSRGAIPEQVSKGRQTFRSEVVPVPRSYPKNN